MRAALLGTGFMGRAHAHALRSLPGFTPLRVELAAVAGRSTERTRAFAEAWGAGRWTTDWRELLADDVDAVHVLGPNHLHAEQAVAAARAGKHVLCEKPLARDAAEARAMADAIESTGVVAMCGFNHRCFPAVRRAHELVRGGGLGAVTHVRATYRQGWGGDPATARLWRMDPAQAGGGALGDLASHAVDLVRYLAGEVRSVSGVVATFVPGREVDDAVSAAIELEGGAIGSVEATRLATGERNRFTIEVDGTGGSLRWDVERLNELVVDGTRELVDNPWWPPGHGLGWGDAFTLQAARFYGAVAGTGDLGPHGATFADGVRAAEVCDAIVRSAQEGRRVSL